MPYIKIWGKIKYIVPFCEHYVWVSDHLWEADINQYSNNIIDKLVECKLVMLKDIKGDMWAFSILFNGNIAHYKYIHATCDKTYNIMSVRFQLKDENQIEKNI